MTVNPTYSTETARAAAERDELGAWVAEFLGSPGSDNAPLGQKLSDPPRSWLGPVEIPIDQLHRLAGPADGPVLVPVDDDEWREDVQDLAEKVDDGAEPPPVIATFDGEKLVLEDGNHRVEALRRAGVEQAWTIVAFDDDGARDRFVERSEQLTT